MSANSDWLKAYEAQRAKALDRLSASKSGSLKDTNVSGKDYEETKDGYQIQ